MAVSEDSHVTHFLNVDLDIFSSSDLQPLLDALERKVCVLHAGRERRRHVAHLELGRRTKNADATIRGFCALIAALPPAARKVWDGARSRDFSIGVQAGRSPNSCDFIVEAKTVKAVADFGGRIVLTVYKPVR
jgi:hypothetical protein